MTNEELNSVIMRAEDEYERIKDTVHEQYDEIIRLDEECKTMNDEIRNYANEIILLKRNIRPLISMLRELDLEKNDKETIREVLNYIADTLEGNIDNLK